MPGTGGRTTTPTTRRATPKRGSRKHAAGAAGAPQTPPAAARGPDAAVETEKRRSAMVTQHRWLCPGPEWPPETETCGRMLPHNGRCAECSRIRTKMRKAERRLKNNRARNVETDEEYAFSAY